MIPSLGMTIGQSISALKKSWKMYKGNLSKGEPTDHYAKLLLKLQAGLGLEQSEFLKEELIGMGYTLEEIEEGVGDGESETTDDETIGLTPPEIQLHEQLRREEKKEDIWGLDEEDQDTGTDRGEWTDLDQRMAEDSW